VINGSVARQKSTRQTFYDRREAGRLLATLLRKFAEREDVVVLGLPRGGVPVAFEVAVAIGAQLDVFTVRKLGVPGHEEFAMGAIGNDGTYVLIEETIEAFGIRHDEIVRVAQREAYELERREHLYRDHREYPLLEGKTVIVIDDGLATGASMLVAVNALRRKRPAKIVVAAPVASIEAQSSLRERVDEVICYQTPVRFEGVGAWYEDFSQVGDGEVRRLLNQAALRGAP
jgi:putative phosphoribosyl transferase